MHRDTAVNTEWLKSNVIYAAVEMIMRDYADSMPHRTPLNAEHRKPENGRPKD